MALAVEGAASQNTVGLGTTFTLNVACGTNSNRFVIVSFQHQIYNGNISSITCNGHAMTSVYQDAATPRLSIYKIAGDSNISTGTNVISVTIDQDRESIMGVIAFSGVDQTAQNRAVSNNSGTSTAPSVTGIASAVDELLFAVGNEIDGRDVTAFGGGTSRWEVSSAFGQGYANTLVADNVSETEGFTLASSSSWKVAAFSIVPAAAATATYQYAATGGLSIGGASILKKIKCFTPPVASIVALSWDASVVATGYKLYYGTSPTAPYNGTGATEGSSPIDVGNVTSFTLNNLATDKYYYFAVTAYDGVEETGYSNILTVRVVGRAAVTIGGAAGLKKGKFYTGAGAVAISGAAIPKTVKNLTAFGGVIMAGVAASSLTTISGGVTSYTATGGVAISGAGIVKKQVKYTPTFIGSITLGWDAAPGATGYRIYYDTNSGVPYSGTGAIEGVSPVDVGNVTQFTLTGLVNNQTYYFALEAYNPSGASPLSGELVQVVYGLGVIEMTGAAGLWQGKSVVGAGAVAISGVAILKKIKKITAAGGVVMSGIAPNSHITGAASTSYTGTGLLTIGGSAILKKIKVFIPSFPRTVTLAWDAVAGATGYKVYYDVNSGEPYSGTGATEGNSPIDVGNVTSFTLNNLQSGATYYFAVTAYSSTAESVYSSEISKLIYPSGSVVMSGAALVKIPKTIVGSGSLFISGAALLKKLKSLTGSGGVTSGGAGITSRVGPSAGVFLYTGTGGLVTGGAATLKRIRTWLGSGGLTTNGQAMLVKILHYTGTGQVTISGLSLSHKDQRYSGSGGLVFGGAADSSVDVVSAGHYRYLAAGGLVISGASGLVVIRAYSGTGGVTIGGASVFVFRRGQTRGTLRRELQYRLGDTLGQIWAADELNAYINEGYDQICRLTLAIWRRTVINDGIGERQGQALYDLPDDFFQMDRVTWDHKRIDPLYRSEIEYASPGYETIEGMVDGYILEEDGLDQIRLVRVPHENDTKTILEYYALGLPIIDDTSNFEIPFRYAKYIRWYALWKALERNGPGCDPKIADHFKQRWQAGLARMIARRESMQAKRVGRLGEPELKNQRPPKPKMPWNYGEEVK